METVTDFILGCSKITADGDCSHEVKRHLLFGRKAMANLDSILKNTSITLPTNVHLVKDMCFLVVIYGCESWTVKKAEHQKLMLLKYGVGEDSWESLGLQGDPTSQSESKPGLHWKDWCSSSTWVWAWPPDVKNWLIGKGPNAGKDCRQKLKGITEDEMVRWHHQFDGHEFE